MVHVLSHVAMGHKSKHVHAMDLFMVAVPVLDQTKNREFASKANVKGVNLCGQSGQNVAKVVVQEGTKKEQEKIAMIIKIWIRVTRSGCFKQFYAERWHFFG